MSGAGDALEQDVLRLIGRAPIGLFNAGQENDDRAVVELDVCRLGAVIDADPPVLDFVSHRVSLFRSSVQFCRAGAIDDPSEGLEARLAWRALSESANGAVTEWPVPAQDHQNPG